MRLHLQLCVFGILTLVLSSCSEITNPPLLFGQSHTVGISVSVTAPDQGGEITIGYKDRNFAIVPVTVKQADGNSTQIKSTATAGHQDALSVLGQFEVSAKASGPEASLGKFFATGNAANKLADGFKAKLSK